MKLLAHEIYVHWDKEESHCFFSVRESSFKTNFFFSLGEKLIITLHFGATFIFFF